MKVTEPIDVYLADKLFQLTSHDLPQDRTDEEYRAALEGKTVVVFGGRYGIGADIASLAERLGADVLLLQPLRRRAPTSSGGRTSRAAREQVLAETGRVDYVVNTAGVLPRGTLEETSEETIYAATEVNYIAPILIAQEFHPWPARDRRRAAAVHLQLVHPGPLRATASTPRPRPPRSTSPRRSPTSGPATACGSTASTPSAPAPRCAPRRSGRSPRTRLLESATVARAALRVLLSENTGHVIDVRRADPFATHEMSAAVADDMSQTEPHDEMPEDAGAAASGRARSWQMAGPDGARGRRRSASSSRSTTPGTYATRAGLPQGPDLGDDEMEVVFVDDGSTDGTLERVRAVEAERPNVRVISIPNSGWPGKPRNIGTDEARGEYVMYVDQDDVVEADALERCTPSRRPTGRTSCSAR